MKRKLTVVQASQGRIRKEFETPDQVEVGRAQQPRVRLKTDAWKHIEMFFKSQKDLCAILETTPKTWRDCKSDEGVREATAQHLLIEFVSLVKATKESGISVDSDTGDKIHSRLADKLDEIYSPYLRNLNFDELVERVH